MMKLLFTNKLIFVLLFLLTFTFSSSLLAQDWESRNGTPTASDLNEVQFVTDEIVYAIGNNGTILKSTDGGETWSDISYETTKNLSSLHFFNENTGLVGSPFSTGGGGSTEMLAKTTDGGENWDVQSSFDFNDFNDMEFLNEQTGWVASADGDVLYTTDGGESWSTSNAGTEDLLDIEIVNDTTLWVSGESGSLFKTTDGGSTWESAIQLDTILVSEFETLSPNDDLYGVGFVTDSVGYVIGKKYSDGYIGFLLKTTDAGENWSIIDYDFQHLLYDIEIGVGGELVLAGGSEYFSESKSGNVIYISEDEGANWTLLRNGNGPIAWNDIDRINNNWIAVGESGSSATFSLSDDTLNSNMVTGINISDLAFYSDQKGTFVTGERFEGKIFTTTDGGLSWNESLALEGRKDFTSVEFAAEGNIWAIGNDHYTGDSRWLIYHSTDHGQNWTKIEPDFPVSDQLDFLEMVQFLDAQTGFIKAEDQFLKTTDGGDTWTQLTSPDSYSFQDFEKFGFMDEQFGWMAGPELIAITTDGGSSWEVNYEQDSMSPEITNAQFLTTSLGYVTMERGDMMKTTDGGETWDDISTFTSYDLNDLYFITADTGYVVGDGGRILITVDGGENFETNYDFTFKNLGTIQFIDGNNGWIAGDKGTLLSTSNGGGIATSNEEEITADLPSIIELQQNYPNPFNPTTNISYKLAENDIVSLEVFDMLGRKVASIVDGKSQNAGSYTVTFDASDLSSGLYLYRLKAGQSLITKKLTVIK